VFYFPMFVSFNPLNRGGDIHTRPERYTNRPTLLVSILLIEAGIFILVPNWRKGCCS